MRTGLVAFGITTAILVPAAIDRLTAGSVQIAKLAAPGARSVTTDGATFDVAIDRAIVDPGAQVHVTVTAREAITRPVKLAVLLMEQSGSSGGRVESPPQRIARELVAFTPGAAGRARALAFTLRGRRDLEMQGVAPFGRYTILVMPPAVADRLEKLRRKAARAGAEDAMEGGGSYEAWASPYFAIGRDADAGADGEGEPDEAALAAVIGRRGETARLDVVTRPAGSPVALRVPDTATAGTPYTAVVTVTNRSKRAVHGVGVRLAMPPLHALEYRGLAEEQLAIEPALATIDLAPREQKRVEFRVTAAAAGVAGLYASTSCDDSDAWDACQAVLDGQLDATDIAPRAVEPAAATGAVVAIAP